MAQPATTIDAPAGQTVIHGSQIVSFNLAGNLIAEDIQWSKGFASVDFADYVNDHGSGNPGAIRRAAYSTTKAIGSMTVQVKSATTVIFPGEFVTFNHPGFANLKFIVTSVGISYTQNGATKFPVSFAESLSDSVLPQIIALDGAFAQSTPQAFLPCGPVRFSRPFMNAGNNVLMYRQKFAVFRPFWQALPPNSVGLGGNFYLIDEEELQDTGVANIVTWDRVYSTVPPSFSEKGSAVKTIKTLMTAFHGSPPVLDAASVRTQTKTVPCDIVWDFYLGSPSVGLPDVSDVSVETIVFPAGFYSFVNATGGYSWSITGGGNNGGYRFLQGEIGRWMGNIYYRKQVFG